MISIKNCQISQPPYDTAVYSLWSILQSATTQSPPPKQSSSQTTTAVNIKRNLLFFRTTLRNFRKKHHVCYNPHGTLRSGLVRPKDEIADMEKCGVIYNIKCNDCDAEYIGKMERTLGTRLKCRPVISNLLCPNTLKTHIIPSTGPV